MKWIVQLQPGCWLADWDGDPGRTLVKDSAKRFRSHRSAKVALCWARTFRPFKVAKIVYDERESR